MRRLITAALAAIAALAMAGAPAPAADLVSRAVYTGQAGVIVWFVR